MSDILLPKNPTLAERKELARRGWYLTEFGWHKYISGVLVGYSIWTFEKVELGMAGALDSDDRKAEVVSSSQEIEYPTLNPPSSEIDGRVPTGAEMLKSLHEKHPPDPEVVAMNLRKPVSWSEVNREDG